MGRTYRIFVVTLGLAAGGALIGSICGVLALTPIIVSHFATVAPFVPVAAAVGAAFGVIAGPVLAWSILRHVPLWRVVLWTAAGTVVGSFYGMAVGSTLPVVGPAVIVGALLGMIGGGILLRRSVTRECRDDTPSALPGVP